MSALSLPPTHPSTNPRYFVDLKAGSLAPAVKDPKKSQAEILDELKPVLTAMMQKMVEAQVRVGGGEGRWHGCSRRVRSCVRCLLLPWLLLPPPSPPLRPFQSEDPTQFMIDYLKATLPKPEAVAEAAS